LERCDGDGRRVAPELLAVRQELRSLEIEAFTGTRRRALRAEKRLAQIIREIGRAYGPSPGTVQMKAGIGLAKVFAALGDDSTAWTSWFSATMSAIQAGKRRFWDRRPIAKLIGLKRDMWAADRVLSRLRR